MNTDDQDDEAQFEPDASSGSTSLPDLIIEAGVAAVTGLPPKAQRNFWKAFGRVFTAGAEWPARILEGKAKIAAARSSAEIARLEIETADLKSQQKARDVVNRGSAKIAVEQFTKPDLAERAAAFHGEHILREQKTREDVVYIAAEELVVNPPDSDSHIEIDDDWLFSFLKEASSRTNEDYKIMFGRILAGEIKKPGSFSIGAAQTLSRLDRDTADIFQKACCLTSNVFGTYRIISSDFADIGGNKLSQLGLPYGNYAKLVEYGLFRSELTEFTTIPSSYFENNYCFFDHADGRVAIIRPKANNPDNLFSNLELKGPALTKIGVELRSVVKLNHSDEYLSLMSNWMKLQRIDLYKNVKETSQGIIGDLVEVQD